MAAFIKLKQKEKWTTESILSSKAVDCVRAIVLAWIARRHIFSIMNIQF